MIECIAGDITTQAVDAIVNAANSALAGGGGVDGAIHRAGGPALMAELKERYRGCPTGSAVITGAGRLQAKFVIHAVGPRYRDGQHGEAGLLASAYRASLELARAHGCQTIAFPSISTGVYGYPVGEAASIACATVQAYCADHPDAFTIVRFVLFDPRTLAAYRAALAALV